MEIPRLIVPVVTPYTDDGSTISEIRLSRVMRHFREQGFEGVLIASDAGEGASLSLAERKKLLEWVVRDVPDMAIYINATSQTTAVAIDLCQDAAETGAVGAVLCPPPVGHLTQDEAVNYLNVMRRHGNIACGFIDPSGHYSQFATAAETTGVKPPAPLAEHGLEHFALTPHGCNCEFWTPSGMVHPAALFGMESAKKMFGKWDAFKPVLQGLLKLAGPARVGKYVMEAQGIECGPLRGPFMPLNPAGREIVDHILKAN